MTEWRRRLLIGIVAVTVLSAGCLGGIGGDDSTDGEDEPSLTGDYTQSEFDAFLDDVAAGNEELETFAYEMSMEMDGEGGSVSMQADGNASVVDEEMKMSFRMSGDGIPASQSATILMYIDGTEAFAEVEGEWVRMPLDETQGTVWNVEDELAVADAQYEHGDVHVAKTDDTVEVTTELDTDAMEAVVEASSDPSIEAAGDVEWRDVEIVERYDAETNRLQSTEMTGEIEQYGQTFDYVFEMEIDDVNEELETTVPAEVREQAGEADETTV